MKLQLHAPSLGAPHHLPASCALLASKPALRFPPRLKISLLPHANFKQTHPVFFFSSFTTCSRNLSNYLNTIEYA